MSGTRMSAYHLSGALQMEPSVVTHANVGAAELQPPSVGMTLEKEGAVPPPYLASRGSIDPEVLQI